MSINYVQTNTLYLAGSGVIIGAVTITVTTLTDIYANVLTMASFGAKGYGTLEPDTTNEEAFTFTGITANANLTYTFTGVKTVIAQTPYTETSGLVRQHSGGTKVVITDNVGFWNTFGNKQNDETLIGRWGTAVVPSAGNDLANKTYVDGTVSAGAPDASTTVKGIARISVAPVSPTIPIAVGQNDPKVSPVSLATVTSGQVAALPGNNTDVATGAGNLFVTQTGLQHNAEKYAADAGSNDTYVITLSPAPTSYTTGMVIYFKANTINTGTATINVNGLGAKTIVKGVSTTLSDGDIAAGQYCTLIYNGTNMVLQNPTATNTLPTLYKTGSVVLVDATTTTIAHGFGHAPKLLSVFMAIFNGSFENSCMGSYDGTTMNCVGITNGGNTNTNSFIISFGLANGDSYNATVTWDATNIYLVGGRGFGGSLPPLIYTLFG